MIEPPYHSHINSARPTDVLDHLFGRVSVMREIASHRRTNYDDPVLFRDAVSRLSEWFGGDAHSVLREPALHEIENDIRALLSDIRGEDPFRNRWAADSLLARYCYLACRLLKPEVVVETGVAYGVSSAFILAALRENGGGVLHSVDLLPLRRRAARFQGIAVPDELRPNWTLHHGSSRRVLPGLMTEICAPDIFLHDSLHTRANMTFELNLATHHLRPGGLILADDIDRNDAFPEFTKQIRGHGIVVADRESEPFHGRAAPTVFGVAIPEPRTSSRYNPVYENE